MAGLEAIASFYVTDGLDTTIQFGSSAKPIPDTYAGLQLRCSMRGDDRNDHPWLRLSPLGSNSGNNSHYQIQNRFSGGASGSVAPVGAKDAPTGSIVFPYMHSRDTSDSFSYSPMVLDIMGYANATTYTQFLYQSGAPSIRGDQYEEGWSTIGCAAWRNTARMTHFTVDAYLDSEGFRRGTSFHLYGYGTS